MWAKSIQENLVQRSLPAPLGIPDPRYHCLARYLIQHLLCNCLRRHLDYLSHHSSSATLRCPICFQVRYPLHFRMDDG